MALKDLVLKKPFLDFVDQGLVHGGVTHTWSVRSKSRPNDPLGLIKWYPGWRRYVFKPFDETLYDAVCLNEISIFLITETAEHRKAQIKEVPRE